ncbi:MAG: DUF11 domain-containing protein [Methanosarcinales archaeon]|nr:MAG: DUF11 domain-containing protein [Methanosarcinales archaeon]
MRISGVSDSLRLILIVILLIGLADAHTYNPDKVEGWEADDISENTMEWGDYIEVYVEHLNTTYTIEVNDFHVRTSEIDLTAIEEEKCKGSADCTYECGDCSEDDYLDQINYAAKTVNIRIYKNQTLLKSFPFHESDGCLESFSTKEGGWDTRGVVWNDANEFFIGVNNIKCEFASDDCFCTDPISKYAKVAYAPVLPPEMETSVELYLLGYNEDGNPEDLPSDDGSSIVRSNSVFKAEITVDNTEVMPAHHVDASVSVKPVEMVKGKYPLDCALQKIYKVEVDDDDDRQWVGTTFPIDVRSVSTTDKLNGSSGVTHIIYFKVPSLPERTKYELQIDLTYEDFKERKYQYTDNSTTIEVLPVIEVKKAIGTEDYAVVASEAVAPYVGETTCTIYTDYDPYIFFTVINWGDYAIPSLKLVDSPVDTWHKPATTDLNVWRCALPADMLKVPDMESDLWNWDFSLEPGEVMTCAYPVSLLKPGTYKLGSATVNWTEDGYNYSMVSYPQPVEVHGPYIEVTKTIDPTLVTQNNTTDVTVIIKNTGDRAASITVMDQLPMESVLVRNPVSRGMVIYEGNESFFLKRVIKAGEVETFDYTIDPNRTVMLPPTVVEFVDITTYEGISVSDMPILTVNGTQAIGAAADVLAEAEAEAKATAEAMNASGSGLGAGMASAEVAETIDTPVRTEPGFTGVVAVLACLAAVLIGRRRK